MGALEGGAAGSGSKKILGRKREDEGTREREPGGVDWGEGVTAAVGSSTRRVRAGGDLLRELNAANRTACSVGSTWINLCYG